MNDKLLNRLKYSYGIILAITGIAKVIAVFGSAVLLTYPDPIFKIRFRELMLAVGILEIAIAFMCFLPSKIRISNYLVAWFSTSLLAYRVGAWYVGWNRPCACLGNITDALHISPESADTAMKIVLAYLLIGSYGSLFWLWWKSKGEFASQLHGEST